jgi:hypothetical protein
MTEPTPTPRETGPAALTDGQAVVVLLALAERFPDQIPAVALEVAAQLEPWQRAALLGGMAGYLSEEQLDTAGRIAMWEMPEPEAAARALAALALQSPPYMARHLLGEAMDAAIRSPKGKERDSALAALDLHKDRVGPGELPSYLAQAGAIPEPYWQVRALLAIAAVLDDPLGEFKPDLAALIDRTGNESYRASLRHEVRQPRRWPYWGHWELESAAPMADAAFDLAFADEPEPEPKGVEPGNEEPIVNVGFSDPAEPDRPLPADMPLPRGTDVYFWMEIGERIEGGIDREVARLPTPFLPDDAVLVVTVHPYVNELELQPGADVGELNLHKGVVTVRRQPLGDGLPADSDRLDVRLFFPVRTPKRAGEHRLRCSIYYERNLVQSRVVTVRVMAQPEAREGALEARVDFNLARSLRADQLREFEPQALNVFFNQNDDGTHGLRVLGDFDGVLYKGDAAIPSEELGTLVEQARGSLRLAMYGQTGDYRPTDVYRYPPFPDPVPREQLHSNLVMLARRGYRIYDAFLQFLTAAGGEDPQDVLEKVLEGRRNVQIALKQSPSLVLPTAIIYDIPLDPDLTEYAICGTFDRALTDGTPLDDTPCFQGQCPSRNADPPNVVCPSGFWGFRHSLGLPFSAGETATLQAVLPVQGDPKLVVNMSTDPGFTRRLAHLQALKSLQPAWDENTTRSETIAALKEQGWHLVYFYCHGGLLGDTPFLQVGPDPKSKDHNISASALRANKVRWQAPGPLVFINGCETTALEPKRALSFVRGFVQTARASGVIGTEVTNFEPLAAPFAQLFLTDFLRGIPVGEAVRRARVALLQKGNPMGLIYIPFVVNSLRLLRQ